MPHHEKPYIRVENLSKTYPTHHVQALQEVSFQLNKGSSTALMGPSGCGKSTLLNVLAGIDSADQGEVWVGDLPIHTLKQKELTEFRKTQVGIVFQQFNILDALTVKENIGLPLALVGTDTKTAQERIQSMLASVGLENRGDFYPSQLSGGQLQRVAVARALIHQPALILADEPTGNLDQSTGDQVLQLLLGLCQAQQATLIIATHSQQAANVMSDCLYLRDGQRIATPAPHADRSAEVL